MFVLERINEYAKTNRIAVINRDESMSFFELNSRSDAFAAYLLRNFGDDHTPVVIYGHKENDFLSAIFGCLKSGHAYVPIDITVPQGRITEIIADAAPKIIVNFPDADYFNNTDAQIINTATLNKILQTPCDNVVSKKNYVSGDMPVYIIFTSGSTGSPKGVPITVNNLTNFYNGLRPYMGEKEGDVILNPASYSFDLSSCPVYAGIACGMTLFSIDRDMSADPQILFNYLRKSNVSVWLSTPSFAELCTRSAAFCAEQLPHADRFLFCGEVLTHKLCDELAERFPSARILNTYGPTEATVLVTAVWVTEEIRRDPRPIPIGRPFGEVKLQITNEGELLIISDSVSAGYYKRPDLSEKVFFTDKDTGKRGYATNDICTCEDGLYYYSGRADNQLKLDGYRIEIEDIENNLTRVENIKKAAVVPVRKDGRVQYLTAFVVLNKDDGLSSMERMLKIKKQAADFLPAYMIPRKIVAADELPLNANGKVDRKSLTEQSWTTK